MPELLFVVTELFRTRCTGQAGVGVDGKPFRESAEGDFPAYKQQERKSKQTPRIQVWDEHQRREHHGIIPVVDPAVAAASVFHKPCLEGTEK